MRALAFALVVLVCCLSAAHAVELLTDSTETVFVNRTVAVRRTYTFKCTQQDYVYVGQSPRSTHFNVLDDRGKRRDLSVTCYAPTVKYRRTPLGRVFRNGRLHTAQFCEGIGGEMYRDSPTGPALFARSAADRFLPQRLEGAGLSPIPSMLHQRPHLRRDAHRDPKTRAERSKPRRKAVFVRRHPRTGEAVDYNESVKALHDKAARIRDIYKTAVEAIHLPKDPSTWSEVLEREFGLF